MTKRFLVTGRSTPWLAIAALLTLVVALLSPLPAGAAGESDNGSLRTQDDPTSAEGTPDDPGDAFAGRDAVAAPSAASVDKTGKSAISPNYNPALVERGDEARPSGSAARLPEQLFPADRVLGDLEEIQGGLAADDGSTVRVLVTARPAAGASANDMAARVDRLAEIEAALAGTGSSVLAKGQQVPVMSVEVTQAGLDALLATEATGAVDPDRASVTHLDSARPVTGADVTHDQQTRGGSDSAANRWEVAILDTGVRTTHIGFGGRVVDEACFVTDSSCPNGTNSQTGPGSGGPNAGGHGTHVAGIASSQDVSNFDGGIAQDSGIIAVNVFNTSASAFDSAIINGIDFVTAREANGAKVAAINLSLGISNLPFTAACDTFNSAMTTAIATARSQGILVTISAGNDGFVNGVSYPSCISGAVSIANSLDNDDASPGSNVHPTVADLWAPGTSITATWFSADNAYAILTGTSMSAPHVAGAVAALADCFDWDTPGNGSTAFMDDDILARMKATGVSLTDNRAGGTATLPRLALLDAARNLNNNDAFSAPEVLAGTAGFNIDYSHCGTEEAGEPDNDGVASGWYEWTAPSDGDLTLTTCDSQTTADTLIHVYTGNAVNSLSEVASNDDDANCAESTLHSTVTTAVTSGTTYRVRVSVFGNGVHPNGVYNLGFSFTGVSNPFCNGLEATIVGTTAGETINGTPGNDVIVAGDGADTVNGMGGNDTICLGGGNDDASGGPGNDWISGGPGNDEIDGNGGEDTIRGSAGNDILNGNDEADQLFGDNGHDILNGNDGDDYLSAHGGADQEFGGEGNDRIFGGPGIDRMFGGGGNDIMGGHGGDDVMYGEDGIDTMSSHAGNDRMFGGANRDRMYGGPDDDTIRGQGGPDIIIGHGGDDNLFGDTGDDYMSGGADTDVCDGGADTDGANVSCESTPNVP